MAGVCSEGGGVVWRGAGDAWVGRGGACGGGDVWAERSCAGHTGGGRGLDARCWECGGWDATCKGRGKWDTPRPECDSKRALGAGDAGVAWAHAPPWVSLPRRAGI